MLTHSCYFLCCLQYLISEEKRCDVSILPESLYPAGLGVAQQPDSLYTEVFSKACVPFLHLQNSMHPSSQVSVCCDCEKDSPRRTEGQGFLHTCRWLTRRLVEFDLKHVSISFYSEGSELVRKICSANLTQNDVLKLVISPGEFYRPKFPPSSS